MSHLTGINTMLMLTNRKYHKRTYWNLLKVTLHTVSFVINRSPLCARTGHRCMMTKGKNTILTAGVLCAVPY